MTNVWKLICSCISLITFVNSGGLQQKPFGRSDTELPKEEVVHFEIFVSYDKHFEQILLGDVATIRSYWLSLFQDIDLLFQTVPNTEISFDVVSIQPLTVDEARLVEDLLSSWNMTERSPNYYWSQLANSFNSKPRSPGCISITLITSVLPYGLWGDKVYPPACRPNTQHFILIDMDEFDAMGTIMDQLYEILAFKGFAVQWGFSETFPQSYEIRWRDRDTPLELLFWLAELELCIKGVFQEKNNTKLVHTTNTAQCRLANGVKMESHNFTSDKENNVCAFAWCETFPFHAYYPTITSYNYPCGENKICLRGNCVQAGVRIMSKKYATCMDNTALATVNLGVCRRLVYQPLIFELRGHSGFGFYMVTRTRQWTDAGRCLFVHENRVETAICSVKKNPMFEWVFVHDEEENGYLLFHNNSKMFLRATENILKLEPVHVRGDESFIWQITRFEGNGSDTGKDFFDLNMHKKSSWMFASMKTLKMENGPASSGSEDESSINKDKTLLIVASASVLVICVVLILHNVRNHWKSRKVNGVLNEGFCSGQLNNLDPNRPVTDQATCLPFDRNLEFPPEKLTLGKRLGHGAFGEVFEASANGIIEKLVSTKVAVKQAMPNSIAVEALLTEMKILASCRENSCIIKLLGVVTTTERIMTIMEYCMFGSLKRFLIRNRCKFITRAEIEMPDMYPTDHSDEQFTSSSYEGYYDDKNISDFDESQLNTWAYQISCGMEFLSGKNILHGDLACRNILLSSDRRIKISDFGLSRELFRHHNYNYWVQSSNTLLPFKWMAIETIQCGVLSKATDCWSFGVVLWELYSLGSSPYAGEEITEEFIERILNGHRLTKPVFAPSNIYELMQQCWSKRPTDRPTFSVIREMIEILTPEITEISIKY